ncbi:MAG: aryl-alcohol dehydrogenase [Acidimicrobiaceae bacterium]|nr:aryl-alcohol dehydrogenase [Acidimicrobiaceae bacterium]
MELAEPRPGEIRVRIVGAGMCHTDVLPRGAGTVSPPPIILGHEGAGVVDALGDDVTGIAVGDHVVLTFDSCGQCENCRRGSPCYCDTFLARNLFGRRLDGSTGVTDRAGAEVSSRWFGQSSFANYATATARNAVVIDKSLPLERFGPLGCGVLTGAGSILVALDVQPGTSVVVSGVGAVGLSAVMAAKAVGAATIVAIDLHEHRLEKARQFGATHALRGDADDLVAQIHTITNGGSNYGFDTTGVPAVILAVLAGVRMTGHMGLVGVQLGDLVLDGLSLLGRTVTGILEGGADPHTVIPRLISLWQDGRFPFDQMIESFPLSEINEAEQASLNGRVIKPVLVPGP